MTTITPNNRAALRSRMGLTANDISQFDVTVDKCKNTYDINVTINGVREIIAFAPRVTRGFKLIVLETQFGTPGTPLRDQASMLEFLTSDVKGNGTGLSLAEVRNRGHILAGLYLAARTQGIAPAHV